MTTKHGRALAELCDRSIDMHLSPAQLVLLELSLYKGGYPAETSAYTKELIERQPSIREYMGSRER